MFNPFSSLPAALLCDLAINYRSSSPLIHHAVIAKMSIYKRMRRACCFDCGRSERDCSCMSGRVRGDVDTRERAFPLSSVSVNDCSTSFRACKFNPTHTVRCLCCLWYHPRLVSCPVVLSVSVHPRVTSYVVICHPSCLCHCVRASLAVC